MAHKSLVLAATGLLIVASLLYWGWSHRPNTKTQALPPVTTAPEPASVVIFAPTNTNRSSVFRSRVRHRASDFTDEERAAFAINFEQRYKPAVGKWCMAYAGHVPLGVQDVKADNFVERIGRDSSYSEYVFVVDGITLGVRDAKGIAQVDYLNDPQQTRKLTVLPKSGERPDIRSPVSREQVADWIEADGGKRFLPHEIRMTPSALSGSLNGGALVSVGGDPRNGATWSYDMVFGTDSKLAFYLRGNR